MRKWIKQLVDILRGSEQDYTELKLSKALVLLAIPMVAEMLLESLFSIVDIYWVSRLGDEAISVVGLTESVMTLVYSVGVGLSMALTGIVARRIGEKQDKKASISAAQSVILAFGLSLLFAIPGLFFTPKILSLMNASNSVIELGSGYMQLMLGSNFIIILLFTNNAIFRSAGAPMLSLRVLLIANLLNIILDPCFIFGLGPFPELGVTGAAVATTTGRSIGVIYQFYLLFRGNSRIKLSFSHFRLHPKIMGSLLKLSVGGISQFLIATSSWIFLYRILASFTTEVIAGYTIAIRILIFFLLPAWGMSNAASTLVGQNLGANKAGRAQKSVWITAWFTSGYMLIMVSVFFFFPGYLIGFFKDSGESYHIAITSLKIIGAGMFFYGLEMVFLQAFNGAGDTLTPTWINLLGFWIIEIPLAWYLSHHTKLQENGVFYSIIISEGIIAVIAVLLFIRGKWKFQKV